MARLTPARRKFAECVAKGMTQADAYREAYPRARKWGLNSVRVSASRLMTDANVSLMVADLQERAAKRNAVTVDSLIAELNEAREMAAAAGKSNDMISATMGKAKIVGFDRLVVDHQSSDGSMTPPTRVEVVCVNPES